MKKEEKQNQDIVQKELERKYPFDTAFRILVEHCTSMLLPVLNEVFGTDYEMKEPVSLLGERQTKEFAGETLRRTMDALLEVRGKKYHIECQSGEDKTMTIRMVEHDFMTASRDKVEDDEGWTFIFPYSAVLYLRSHKKTPKKLRVRFVLQNRKEASYEIPVIRVEDYTKEEIIGKDLMFFLPFYIMRYEKDLQIIADNEEKLKAMKETYKELVEYTKKLRRSKKISELDQHELLQQLKKLVNYVARDYETIRREVVGMADIVLKSETQKVLEAGRKEGREEGFLLTLSKLMNKGMTFEEVCELCDVPKTSYGYYKASLDGLLLREAQGEYRIVNKEG